MRGKMAHEKSQSINVLQDLLRYTTPSNSLPTTVDSVMLKNLKVKDLLIPGSRGWNISLIHWASREKVFRVLSNALPEVDMLDRLEWEHLSLLQEFGIVSHVGAFYTYSVFMSVALPFAA
ncbi:hypothetical protein COCNU_03G006440 [Cocos nucifera]|uniref:Uncharacterized protein n=1 Tax=Cocos nucifera TaxID=13894 RepID=A0A8K0MYJ2_COCNU|nr:hypothetical protein COCNU_03G006440 [Cocos nucifera]